MKNEIKEIIHMVINAAIIAFTIAGIIHTFTFESKMEEVRNQTIEEAILVSIDNDGYTLSFNGEEHYYSFS